jgi:hypothetical protein
MTEPVVLVCSLFPPGMWASDVCYVVKDPEGSIVASGVSSSPDWVKHDAGGHHTRRNFDGRYGPGQWVVRFDWEP